MLPLRSFLVRAMVSALIGCLVNSISVTAKTPPTQEGGYFQFDRLIAGSEDTDSAISALAQLRSSVDECESLARTAAWYDCALGILFGPAGFRASSDTRPIASTVTHALSNREGTCAGLVAAVLLSSSRAGDPFEPVILEDHVVLLGRYSGLFYEVLKGGRVTAPPSRDSTIVSAAEFLPYYLDNLAARLAEVGENDLAERLFQWALDHTPSAGRIRYNYGTFLLKQGKARESLAQLDRALRWWPDARVHVNRGVCLVELGSSKRAGRAFRRALAIDPTNREALSNLQAIRSRANSPR